MNILFEELMLNDKQNHDLIHSCQNLFEILTDIEKTIFNLTQENLDISVLQTMKLYDPNYSYSFNLFLFNLIFSSFYSQNDQNYIYFYYLEDIELKEKEISNNNAKVIEFFYNYISKFKTQESYYLINQMIKRNLVDLNVIDNIPYKLFAQYKTLKENKKIYLKDAIESTFLENYKILSNNDFELHKKYIDEGHNPNEIAKIIRNDEIEKLQEISSQKDFDYNQIIEPSLYERCSFINKECEKVSLIDLAAFFDSIQCFRYLLINNANVNNTGKYAVAGGNLEIIHLCEQNHSLFENAYETAIMFHRNEIFKYLYENNFKKVNNLSELGTKCIVYQNYEIFMFLQENGMKINDEIINKAAEIGNLYLVEYLIQNNYIPREILIYSTKSGNIELVNYVLTLMGIDIKVKDIY